MARIAECGPSPALQDGILGLILKICIECSLRRARYETVIERFSAIPKIEEVNGVYAAREEASKALTSYILGFYARRRVRANLFSEQFILLAFGIDGASNLENQRNADQLGACDANSMRIEKKYAVGTSA